MARARAITRRSQRERSAATVTKLLESTADAMVELGYAGATTREICERAGISQGGLFRHFPTRLDLVAAAVEHVYDEQVEQLQSAVAQIPADESRECVRAQIRAAREIFRQPRYMVLLEAVLACRTEPELVEALSRVLGSHDDDLSAAARLNPVFARLSTESQHVMRDIGGQMLALEVLFHPTLYEPELEDVKLEALIDLVFLLDASERAERESN